jgi:hypothetical protein
MFRYSKRLGTTESHSRSGGKLLKLGLLDKRLLNTFGRKSTGQTKF